MRNINKLLITIILIATTLLGIGYSAIQNITLDIEGTVIANTSEKILITGQEFNKLLKGSTSESTSDTTITKIVFDYWGNGYIDNETVLFEDSDWASGIIIDEAGVGGIRLFKSPDGTKAYILSEDVIYANSDCSQMFRAFNGVTDIAFNNFDTSKSQSMRRMFADCSSLMEIDLRSFDTSKVQDMRRIFSGCSSLKKLDLAKFDTTSVTNMSMMFYGCSGLTNIDVSKFDTTNVTDMGDMFFGCSGLTRLDLANFNTSNVTGMSYMFYGCKGLTSLDLTNFDTANVTSMESMFQYATKLKTIDLSSFDTCKVTLMTAMFAQCGALEKVDISNFNTSKVTRMDNMFRIASKLTIIYVSDEWTNQNVTKSTNMFNGCINLVGGAGTTYNSSYIDKTYARVDGGPNSETPGYLTLKSSSE